MWRGQSKTLCKGRVSLLSVLDPLIKCRFRSQNFVYNGRHTEKLELDMVNRKDSGSALMIVLILLGVSVIIGGSVSSYITNIFKEVNLIKNRRYGITLKNFLNEALDCNMTLPPGPCSNESVAGLIRTDTSSINILYKKSPVVVACDAGTRNIKISSQDGKLLTEHNCL